MESDISRKATVKDSEPTIRVTSDEMWESTRRCLHLMHMRWYCRGPYRGRQILRQVNDIYRKHGMMMILGFWWERVGDGTNDWKLVR